MRVKELYPDTDTEYFCIADYQPILKDLSALAFSVSDDDCQGYTLALYNPEPGCFGILELGWGSCSMCDALQNCSNFEEVQELYDELKNWIHWFESAEDLLFYLETHDWEGSPIRTDLSNRFIRMANSYVETSL